MSIWQRILQGLRNALGVRSPSAEAAKVYATVADEFQRGLEAGKKDPLFWWDADGIFHRREMTPEELHGLAMCRQIVARAFPGYFDNEEEQP